MGRGPVLKAACLLALIGAFAASGCGTKSANFKGTEPLMAGGRHIADWVKDLKSTDVDLRFKSLKHIGNYGAVDPTEAFPAVLGALKDPEVKVRREAIRAMLCFRDNKKDEAIAALNDVKEHDQEPKLRGDAETVIKAIQDK